MSCLANLQAVLNQVCRKRKQIFAMIMRNEFLSQMLDDKEWIGRLEKAENGQQVLLVVKAFCRSRGYTFHHEIVTGRMVPCK